MGVSNIDLAVVGSIGIDTIETRTEKQEEILGGSVSYACAAASFFTRVGMVGVVGTDFPEEYAETYRRFGIDTTGLQEEQGKTFRWSGVYDDDMVNRQTISTDLNVLENFSPELPESYKAVPYLLLGNISPELQLHVFSQVQKPKFVIADTMDLWINIARDALMEVISKVNMLTLNDSEARLLTGKYNLRECAETLLGYGPQYVVIKKGEHGAMLLSKEGIFIVPAYPVGELEDPTGAGDSFAGGFMGVLAKGGVVDEATVRKALLYGSVVASFGVEKFSLARLESLEIGAIESRLVDLESMMTVG